MPYKDKLEDRIWHREYMRIKRKELRETMPFKDKERNREWHRLFMFNKRKGLHRPHFNILERDSFRCQYCGKTPRDGIQLQVDHIVPRSLGGSNDDSNLITACAECNASKRDRLLRRDAEQEMLERCNFTPKVDADGYRIYDE